MRRSGLPISFIVFFALTSLVNAQEQQGGGQAPQVPATQPQQPQQPPRQPAPTPAPSPTQGQNISIRGRIIGDGNQTSYPMIEVRFEVDGGQPVGFAYTDPGGEFRFQGNRITADQTLYVFIKADGYKPYRERINGLFSTNSFEGSLTIFLEREDSVKQIIGGPQIVDLKQLRAKIPGKAVDEYEKALKESSKGNRGKAVDGLQRAVKLAPDFYEAQHTLGVQFLAMQKYQEAETAFLRAKDLSPNAAEPLINLGSLYYQRGETEIDAGEKERAAATFEKAADFLDESIRRNPLSASAHSYLGAALYKLAAYERAESTLQRALELDEGLADARLMLVNVYARQARYGEALEQTNIFLTKFPKAPQRAALEGIKKQIENLLSQK
jgi:tetratricopeptide (TPR) repeat protein